MILVLLLPLIVLYFLPAIVALTRGRQTGVVLVVNLFFGWTFLGWMVALAFAVSSKPQPPVIVLTPFGSWPYGLSCPAGINPAQQPYPPLPSPAYPAAPCQSTATHPRFQFPAQLPPQT